MIVLVINAGSTSLKVDVFAMPGEECLASASVQRIGKAGATVEIDGARFEGAEQDGSIEDHDDALARVLDALLVRFQVDAVGHRVVHGGDALTEPAAIDDAVCRVIEDCSRFAPLHNPANLAGIAAARARLPAVPQVAVTDTGFHRSLPPPAYLYALPYELYRAHGIRRYGFHGSSHQYVGSEAARLLERDVAELRLVSCHLGGGASVCAIDGGRSVETSMGMTPLEGLAMGTRCGDVDPGVVLYLQRRLSMSPEAVDEMLNRDSGLLGISGISRDMRDIIAAADGGHERARLALDIFCRRVRQYIGAYLAQLGGAHAVIFTGGIGEHSAVVRAHILDGMAALGLVVDERANRSEGSEARVVSTSDSPVALLVIPTDEELQIAREVHRLISHAAPDPPPGP